MALNQVGADEFDGPFTGYTGTAGGFQTTGGDLAPTVDAAINWAVRDSGLTTGYVEADLRGMGFIFRSDATIANCWVVTLVGAQVRLTHRSSAGLNQVTAFNNANSSIIRVEWADDNLLKFFSGNIEIGQIVRTDFAGQTYVGVYGDYINQRMGYLRWGTVSADAVAPVASTAQQHNYTQAYAYVVKQHEQAAQLQAYSHVLLDPLRGDANLQAYSNVDTVFKPNKSLVKTVVTNDKPRGYWEFEEADGATQFVDSLHGHLLVEATGGGVLQRTSPDTFPGSTTRVVYDFSPQNYLTWSSQPVLTGTFSVECWVRVDAATTTGGIWGSRDTRNDFATSLYINNGAMHLDVGNGSGWLVNAVVAASIAVGDWYHLVSVVTPTSWTLYRNGTQVGTGTYSGTPILMDANHQFAVGRIGTNHAGYFFSGSIDELAVYDKVLSPERIAVRSNSETAAIEAAGASGFTGWGVPI